MLEKVTVDEKSFPERSHRFTAIYSRDKEYLWVSCTYFLIIVKTYLKISYSFDLSQQNFFTSAVRSRIVQFILDRKKFSREPKNDFAFGIQRLITEGAYIAAYPLHDVRLDNFLLNSFYKDAISIYFLSRVKSMFQARNVTNCTQNGRPLNVGIGTNLSTTSKTILG